MLKALFDMIRQSTAARVNTSIATGIDVAIRRISAECDFCAAPLDTVLAEIVHIVVVQDNSSMHDEPGLSSMVVCSSDDATVSDNNDTVITSLPHPPYFLLGCGTIT